MVFLDPERDGCTIYNDMMVSYLEGRPDEVCYDLINRVCCGVDNYCRPRQIITVGVTRGGIGEHYIDVLRGMGLQHVVEIPSKHIEIVLPIIDRGDS